MFIKGKHADLTLLIEPNIWLPLINYILLLYYRLKTVYPNCIIEKMLAPAELRTIFKKTLLNVHPAYYEAYGLTIGEACVFGAPSILDKDAIIGIITTFKTNRSDFFLFRNN